MPDTPMTGAEAEEAELASAIHRNWQPSAGAQALAHLETHERVCALRYQGIMDRVGRLETIIMRTAAALLLGMAGAVATVFLHLPK